MTITEHQPVTDPLAGYRPGAPFFFASPRGSMLADDVWFEVPHSVRPEGLPDLPGRVGAGLELARAAGYDDPVVVGAVPYDPAAPARLIVPRRLRRGGPPAGSPVPTAPVVTGGPPTVVPVPAPDDYADAVRRAVCRMRRTDGDPEPGDPERAALEKVVLSRALDVTARGPIDPALLLRRLAARDPRGYTYAVDLGGGRTLVGASPELLVSRRGDRVTANPLAGSVPRAADPVADRERGQALLASGKDLREHAVVVRAVAGALRPLCTDLVVPATPTLVRTASMWHLSTVVTGRVPDPTDPAASALSLASALHPTPAVCGTPRAAARAVIAADEGYDRDFYTGAVGWSDVHGDGEWVVTIRCAVTRGSAVRLYAGAGVVADSDPDAELAETAAKFRTLLDGLGL